jgi:hypothetical protein
MFQHVTVLVSFIFALALTHVFSSASNLIIERERVHFCGLLALTMLNAALGIIINWLFLFQLHSIKRWSLAEVLLQLMWVVPQYFTASLVAMPRGKELDMTAFYERQRPAIYSAFVVMFVLGGFENFADRHNLASWGSTEWVGAVLISTAFAICSIVAGWAKAQWLQWAGVIGMFVLSAWFLASYTISS